MTNIEPKPERRLGLLRLLITPNIVGVILGAFLASSLGLLTNNYLQRQHIIAEQKIAAYVIGQELTKMTTQIEVLKESVPEVSDMADPINLLIARKSVKTNNLPTYGRSLTGLLTYDEMNAVDMFYTVCAETDSMLDLALQIELGQASDATRQLQHYSLRLYWNYLSGDTLGDQLEAIHRIRTRLLKFSLE